MKRPEKFIIQELRAGRFELTLHARERMNERSVSELDIIEVAKTNISIRYQIEKQTYLLHGTDSWGEELFVAAAIRENIIIVTIFYEEPL